VKISVMRDAPFFLGGARLRNGLLFSAARSLPAGREILPRPVLIPKATGFGIQ
jgi:hypothetical protein